MTPTERAILDLAAARGEVVLAGNRESLAYLRHQPDGRWLRIDGDTMTGQKDASELTEAEVLRAIFWRAREMLGTYGPDDGSVLWQDVLDWLRASHI